MKRFDIAYYWYQRRWHGFNLLMLPFSFLFGLIVYLRRQWLTWRAQPDTVPVIVVGNVTVGGTGKTPFVIWLAHRLKQQGYRPGIVCRGVGGQRQAIPQLVQAGQGEAARVGDEAVLLAQRTNCPVMVCRNRSKAAAALERDHACNVVISDDGLQHYRMKRVMEIVMVDATRQFGNGWLLPAGPLREPVSRIHQADRVVVHGDQPDHDMQLEAVELVSLLSPDKTMSLDQLKATPVHAVAGIGHPERFFTMLRQQGYHITPHAFPDHYSYLPQDLNFADGKPIIMTEKDAVKCLAFATEQCWFVRVNAKINQPELEQSILQKLQEASHA